jgi:hypothetical protein
MRAADGRAYVIVWRTSAFNWQAVQSYYRLIIVSFHP